MGTRIISSDTARNGYRLVNTGSVGQNRQHINVADYALYDQEKREFALKKAKYDLELVRGEMRARNYPKECMEYYLGKARS